MFPLKVIFYKSLMQVMKQGAKFLPQPMPFIFSGPSSSEQLVADIAMRGHSKVLLVTDKGLVKLGLVAQLTTALQQRSIRVVIYDEVLPDPDQSHVELGLQCLQQQQCDAVLALGGGSSIDVAKIISVAATNARPLAKLAGLLKIRQPGLPLFAIPTTAGTGSEVTAAAVISTVDRSEKQKFIDPKLIPSSIALDPLLMLGLPAPMTAATGLDALTHAVESYLSGHASESSRRYSRLAVKLIFEYLPQAYREPDNIEARQAMAQASCYAGCAFTRANLGYVHAIAHQLGARYHLPHGLLNAVAMPYVLDFSQLASEQPLAELADVIALAAGQSNKEKSCAFIAAIRALNCSLDIPETLAALAPDDIPTLAQAALQEAHYFYPVPRYMDQQQCENLLARLLALPNHQEQPQGATAKAAMTFAQ